MSTYKVRVEDKIGSVGDDTALSDFLTAGAKYITNLLPIERLLKYSNYSEDEKNKIIKLLTYELPSHSYLIHRFYPLRVLSPRYFLTHGQSILCLPSDNFPCCCQRLEKHQGQKNCK